MIGRVRTKVCGITRIEDGLAAAAAGVDAIGFVFWQPAGPRYVDPEQARRIAEQLPPFVTTVGLFVNATEKEIRQVLQQVPLDILQFHGDETPEACAGFGKPWMKAIRVRPETDLKAEAERYGQASALLLDAYHPALPGGTGESFDWQLIPEDLGMPVVLAGGLNAGNVAGAIEQVKPWAVDVSGGVEQSKGIKDETKITAFVNEVLNAG
ncbi:phosphoribosylanthranilate isomerase [Endozoicomonadaceae bacterium StTr2]